MGLDVGDRTIGIAFSDALMITAQSYETYRRKTIKEDIDYIIDLVSERDIDILVFGVPYNMNGEINTSSEKIINFSKKVKKKLTYSDRIKKEVRVDYMDERLTTKQMERIMIMHDASRKTRAKNIDKLCAQLILQTYMDMNSTNLGEKNE